MMLMGVVTRLKTPSDSSRLAKGHFDEEVGEKSQLQIPFEGSTS